MPSAFDDRERAAIRTRLVEAAKDALRRGGLAAASVSDLAAVASIAKGSFYSFFASKEELFMEALEDLESRYRSGYAAAAAGSGPPAERLRAAFDAAFRFAEAEPALRHLDGASVERLARALPPERVARHVAADAEAMAGIAEAWKAEGLLREDATLEELAGAAYAVFLVSLGLGSLPEPAGSSAREVVSRGLALALSPLAAPPAAAQATPQAHQAKPIGGTPKAPRPTDRIPGAREGGRGDKR